MQPRPKLALEMRVGEILVRFGYLNESELEQALAVQRERREYKPLGEICKELGFISGPVLRDVLNRYRKQILLGELLHKTGAISDDQLSEALKEQRRSGEKLGKILIKKGFLTSSALIDSLCVQLGITKIHPKREHIDSALLNKANSAYFAKKRVIPLRLDTTNRILTVVMEDPTDGETVGDLQKMFNAAVEPVICPSGEVELLLKQVFDAWFIAR